MKTLRTHGLCPRIVLTNFSREIVLTNCAREILFRSSTHEGTFHHFWQHVQPKLYNQLWESSLEWRSMIRICVRRSAKGYYRGREKLFVKLQPPPIPFEHESSQKVSGGVQNYSFRFPNFAFQNRSGILVFNDWKGAEVGLTNSFEHPR